MSRKLHLHVHGGASHLLLLAELRALQAIVTQYGADAYPLLLRAGATHASALQPVTSRALLAEIEKVTPYLAAHAVPGIGLEDAKGADLGTLFARSDGGPILAGDDLTLDATYDGIRLTLRQFPPPVGFRSAPGLKAGEYECYYTRIAFADGHWHGIRTPAMGGSGAAVELPPIPLPPVTRWDVARVSGRPAVALLRFLEQPATQVYSTLLHGLISACNDSIRLKAPLQMRREA